GSAPAGVPPWPTGAQGPLPGASQNRGPLSLRSSVTSGQHPAWLGPSPSRASHSAASAAPSFCEDRRQTTPGQPLELTVRLACPGSGGVPLGCPQFRLRLLQPEGHTHLAVHRGRGGQVLLRLRLVAGAVVEGAEAKVAVRDEGAHLELVGPCEGLAIVLLG